MGRTSKTSALLLTLIIVMSCLTLLIVKPVNAQTIPTPSAPEFSVSFVDRSYTVPITTTQTTDPFTGKQVTHTSGGQYVKNQTVDIKIRNPQITSATLPNGSIAQLYYSVRTKGHFSDNWGESYDNRWTTTWKDGDSFAQVFAATSDYTVVTLVIGSPNDILMGHADVYIPAGGQEDFQVEASFGYQYTIYTGLYPTGKAFASYTNSGWSPTLTITLTDGAISSINTSSTPSPSQSSTPTPTLTFAPSTTPIAPDTNTDSYDSITLPLTTLVAVIIVILLLVVAVLVLALRRHRTTATK